jgi:hypothetical protein
MTFSSCGERWQRTGFALINGIQCFHASRASAAPVGAGRWPDEAGYCHRARRGDARSQEECVMKRSVRRHDIAGSNWTNETSSVRDRMYESANGAKHLIGYVVLDYCPVKWTG